MKKFQKVISLLLIVFVVSAFIGPSTVFAATWSQQDKITASDAASSDFFGYRVSISGNYAVVGAYGDESSTGAAYVFIKSGSSWTQQKKLTASDAATDDEFGKSVFISGDYIAVGAPDEDGAGTDRGAVYIFYRNEGGTNNWGQQAKLTASDGADSDWLGNSVSISGDYVIAGAFGDDTGGGAAGSAYIFEKGGSWSNSTETQMIQSSDITGGDSFGYSVSISGTTAIIGASGKNSNTGAAYIFERSGTWSQSAKLTASDGAGSDFFGISASIDSDTSVVGAYGDESSTGAIYLFEKGGAWSNSTETAKLTASDGAGSDRLGYSVSISGGTVIAGSYGDETNTGAAYLYEKGGNWSNMTETQKITASDAATGDNFGRGVSISGYYSVIGAPYNDDDGGSSGSAYVFESSMASVPEFTDYVYFLTILIAVGLMYKVIPRQKTKEI
ncbi:hypothetical protein GF366_01340 [Candidatus Peregrinibacteria bacterium]|nr:hypothetical protein [Candidatus Peregrinibacteria bacterium]